MKKVQTTTWLDLLTYIILPLVIVGNVIDVVGTIFNAKMEIYTIIVTLVEVAFTIFYAYTVYRTHQRSVEAPKLLRVLFWLTALTASFDYANTKYANDGTNLFLTFFLYFAICYVLWIRTNEIYINKRKDLFKRKKDGLKTIYRCPECKRLIPVGKPCPHCEKESEKDSFKEEEKELDKESTK